MGSDELTDGVVCLRSWHVDDADWYADIAANDEQIQRFTSESPTVTADDVRSAIVALPDAVGAVGFLVADAQTGDRLGNLALRHEQGVGEVSYWLAPAARGRGAATRAVRLLSAWAFASLGLTELRLWARLENVASRAVARRSGYWRDPDHDERREVKGSTWDTVAYVLRPSPDSRTGGAAPPAPYPRARSSGSHS